MTAVQLCLIISMGAADGSVPLYRHRVSIACKVAPVVIKHASANGIDPLVAAGLIYAESGWKADAVSRAKACGLTQVIGRYVGKTCAQLKRPETAIEEGMRILAYWKAYTKKRKSRRLKNHLAEALTCYNAGYACSKYPRSRAYAHKVLKTASRYQKILSKLIAKK